MVRKIISCGIRAVALLALLGSVSINARGQCTAVTSNFSETLAFSGLAVKGGGLNMIGGGSGFSINGRGGLSASYTLGGATTVNGDLTAGGKVSAFGGASTASAGIILETTHTVFSSNVTNYLLVGFKGANIQVVSVQYNTRTFHYGVTTDYSAPFTAGLPYFLQITRSGSTLSAQSSPDGTTWTTLYSLTTSDNTSGEIAGVYAFSDLTSGDYANITFDTTEVNGTVMPVTVQDFNDAPNYGAVIPILQAGVLGFADSALSGSTVQGGTGCTPWTFFGVNSNLELDKADGTFVAGGSIEPVFPSCDGQSSCNWSFANPLNYPNSGYTASLAHGTTYILKSTVTVEVTPPSGGFQASRKAITFVIP